MDNALKRNTHHTARLSAAPSQAIGFLRNIQQAMFQPVTLTLILIVDMLVRVSGTPFLELDIPRIGIRCVVQHLKSHGIG